jgi:endoglucanase
MINQALFARYSVYNMFAVCRVALWALVCLLPLGGIAAQSSVTKPDGDHRTPMLHVSGRFLQDQNGRNILLHGWYQPAQSWFNGGGANYPDPTDYTKPSNVSPALKFLEGEADILSHKKPLYGASHGWDCTFVRLNGTNNNDSFAPGWDNNGKLTNPAQFRGWLTNLIIPYANHCHLDGLYVTVLSWW